MFKIIKNATTSRISESVKYKLTEALVEILFQPQDFNFVHTMLRLLSLQANFPRAELL